MDNLPDLTGHFHCESPSSPVRHMPFAYICWLGYSPEVMDAVINGQFRVSDPEYLFFVSIAPVQRILFEGTGDLSADAEDHPRALQFMELMHTVCEEIGQDLAHFENAVEALKTGSHIIYNPVLRQDIEDLRNDSGFLVPELEMARTLRAYCEGKATLRDTQETALRLLPCYEGLEWRDSLTAGFLRHSLKNNNFGQGIGFDPGMHVRLGYPV